MLFADAADPALVWIGPVLATVGASVAALFSWLSSRDKLQFDATLVELRAQIATLTAHTAECHEERKAERERADRLEDEIGELRRAMLTKQDTPRE